MTAASSQRYIGQSVRRVEDARILRGRGRYVDDLVPGGVVHAAFVYSPIAHARIANVDAEAARGLPQVLTVITGAELESVTDQMGVLMETPGHLAASFPALAVDKVRFVGDPVAMVVAESRRAAEDGCRAVEVEYEPLEAVMTAAAARNPDFPPLFEELDTNHVYAETHAYGEPEAAFSQAASIVSHTMHAARVAHCPMEPRGGMAEYDAGTEVITYHAATQSPHAVRVGVSRTMRHPLDRFHVVAPDIGGAFGQKGFPNREDVAVCYAARLLRRPVKWVEDRKENLTTPYQGRGESLTLRAAVDEEGVISALEAELFMDQGAYPLTAAFHTKAIRLMLPSIYRISHFLWHGHVIATNRAPFGPFRGPWAMETLGRETLIDRVAQTVGIDPVEIRRRNMVSLEEQPRQMATGPTLEGAATLETLERAVELVEYDQLRSWQEQVRAQGRLVGIGVACFIEPAPGPPDIAPALGLQAPPERAFAQLELDGRITVCTHQSPHGQGHETTLAQVAASEFGVPIEHVRVLYGDTRTTPFSIRGTSGSRAGMMATGAVLHATRAVKEKVFATASKMLEISPEDLRLSDGIVAPVGAPARGVPLARIAMMAHFSPQDGVEPNLRSYASWSGEPRGGWSGGTHICVVEVDRELGTVAILRYVVVEDCGKVINPAIVDGQVRGGVAQGIGIALLESAEYDDDGNLLTTTFMDYLLPGATDVPTIEIEHLESKVLGEVDFRGVGEGGTIGAVPAVVNAVADALGGVEITKLPLTPERVLALADAAPPER